MKWIFTITFLLFTFDVSARNYTAADWKNIKKSSYKKRFRFDIAAGYYQRSTTTQASETTNAASASGSEDAFEARLHYLFGSRWGVNYGYRKTLGLLSEVQSSGQRVAGRWYFKKSPIPVEVEVGETRIIQGAGKHFYAELSYKDRDFDVGNSLVRFTGFSAGAGYEMGIFESNVLTFTFEYDMLTNGEVRKLTAFGASVGIGQNF